MKFTYSIPSIGIFFFIGLYVYSSTLYPGGSQADLNAIGFDWINNYWCNLMNEKAMNGQVNPAKPFAIFAFIVLCLSLMIFFIQFANHFSKSLFWKKTIQICGVISMLFASLIATKYHDLMTIIASVFGVFVVLGIIIEIYKSHLRSYKITGAICILLLLVNNYIYYSHQAIEWLPLVQKITFAITLAWVVGLNWEGLKRLSNV